MHTPVLLREVLWYLDSKPHENFIDATVGQGGHAKEVLRLNAPDGKLLGIDWDASQADNSKAALAEFGSRAIVAHGSCTEIPRLAAEHHLHPVHGILVDLGMSSWQLESGKGFSFQKDEPLDMRYDTRRPLTAETIANEWPEGEIARILDEYGEERFARRIAAAIAERRKRGRIATTAQLREVIAGAIPRRTQAGNIHYATRTFQALRIAVNGELDNVAQFLPMALEMLAPGGRLVAISFHSLEDRMVKHFFQEKAREGSVTLLTKKPVTASAQEVAGNPRARSAKLRAFMKKI